MTTDNRANEPTPEQVEAAAKATHETRNPWIVAHGDWGAAGFEIKKAFRESARAALMAAQGVVRPEVGRLDLARHYWRSQGYDYDLHGQDGNNDYEMGLAVADAALAALAAARGAAPQADEEHFHIWSEFPCKPGQCRMDHAPVLPSSTVDEDAAIQLVQDLAREAYEAYEDSSDDAYGAWSWLTGRHEQMRAGRVLSGKEKNE